MGWHGRARAFAVDSGQVVALHRHHASRCLRGSRHAPRSYIRASRTAYTSGACRSPTAGVVDQHGPGLFLEASALLLVLIHSTSWNGCSAKFASIEFYEVR